jgi:hypothetical protein
MIAQTTKGNSESTTVANGTELEEKQATTTVDWNQILVLQGVSAKSQEAQPETTSTQAQDSNRQSGFFSRFAARLGKMYDRITGPAATDQERRQASVMVASTRNKSWLY